MSVRRGANDEVRARRLREAAHAKALLLPAHGRDFTAEDDVPNGPAVCVISDALWASRFGRRESIVGEVIQLNGQSWQVVGIMPPQFTAPFQQVQVFAPRVFVADFGSMHPQWNVTKGPANYENWARDTVEERLTTAGFRLAQILHAIWP